jgi:hypothetical protein
MGDGAVLGLFTNLAGEPVAIDPPLGQLLFESRDGAAASATIGILPGLSTVAFLEPLR